MAVTLEKYREFCTNFEMRLTEETFVSFGFESIFLHLEIISNGRPIKVLNDRIDISKSKSLNDAKISPVQCHPTSCSI